MSIDFTKRNDPKVVSGYLATQAHRNGGIVPPHVMDGVKRVLVTQTVPDAIRHAGGGLRDHVSLPALIIGRASYG